MPTPFTELAKPGQEVDPFSVLKGFSDYMQDVRMKQQAHTGTLLHGPGGLFNTPGLDSAIISTHVTGRGLGQLLPAFPSTSTHPWFGLLTGFSDDQGSEPTYPCDDAPAGYIKSGTLTARFGRIARGSNDIRIPDTLFQINSGENLDLQLIGQMLNTGNNGVLYPSDLNESNLLDMVTKAEMISMGVRFERLLSRLLWSGDGTGANDTAGGGYKEFPGLDNQIATGYVDAETNATMPSADSVIVNANYGDLDNGYAIVGLLEEVMDYLENLAEDTGVAPVQFVIVMRPMLFRKLTSLWPVQYNTMPDHAILTGSTTHQIILDARSNVSERDGMRQGLYLDLNAKRYNIVLDTGIVQEDSTDGLGVGEFASGIKILPLSINGNFPTLYWEYLDQKLGVPQTNLVPGMATWYTDAGRFLWSWKTVYTCFKLQAEIMPRVVLRTPHLAARIDNLLWHRDFPLRDADPTSDYWVNGGVSAPNRSPFGPTQHAPWLS
jgi:hypothetical protein